MTVRGIDVSHNNDHINWKEQAGAGEDFAFIKATEGVDFVDPLLEENRKGAHHAGLVVGFYHYGHPKNDPVAEANHFVHTVGEAQPGELPLALDIETHDGQSTTHVRDWCERFLHRVRDLTARTPIVYCSSSFINDVLGSNFSAYRLWVAQWGAQSAPDHPHWPTWTFWQYDGEGLDRDRFNGSLAELHKLAHSEAPTHDKPAPPPPAETPSWYHRPLRKGDQGADVKVVQRKVHTQPTGHFNADTDQRVRGFQKAHHLDPDGIVGPKTARAFGDSPTHGQQPQWYTRVLGLGMTGADVFVARHLLHMVEEGETYDPAMVTAVMRYQSEHHLTVDGFIGPDTAKELGDA